MDSRSRQNHGADHEQHQDPDIEAAARGVTVDQLAERRFASYCLGGVNLLQRPANQRQKFRRGNASAEYQIVGRNSDLGVRHVDVVGGLHNSAVACVRGNTYDSSPFAKTLDSMQQRVTSGRANAVGHGFADDGDLLGCWRIVIVEVAAGHERGSDRVEIPGSDNLEIRLRQLVRITGCGLEFEHIFGVPSNRTFEGPQQHGGRAVDCRRRAQAIQQFGIKAAPDFRIDARATQRQVHRQRVPVNKAEIGMHHGLVTQEEQQSDGKNRDGESGLGEDKQALQAAAGA